MADTPSRHALSKEQKTGFVFMLVFAIVVVALGALQLRNTIYGPFIVHATPKDSAENIYTDEESRLRAIDTDHDGLTDYDEIYVYHTSPYLPDTDSDGVADKTEIDRGTDPNCAEGTTCLNAEATPTTSSSVKLNIDSGAVSPVDQLDTTAPQAAATVDINTIINDPKKLREYILGTGKISAAQLDKIDDATLLKMAGDLGQAAGSASAQANQPINQPTTSSLPSTNH